MKAIEGLHYTSSRKAKEYARVTKDSALSGIFRPRGALGFCAREPCGLELCEGVRQSVQLGVNDCGLEGAPRRGELQVLQTRPRASQKLSCSGVLPVAWPRSAGVADVNLSWTRTLSLRLDPFPFVVSRKEVLLGTSASRMGYPLGVSEGAHCHLHSVHRM